MTICSKCGHAEERHCAAAGCAVLDDEGCYCPCGGFTAPRPWWQIARADAAVDRREHRHRDIEESGVFRIGDGSSLTK